MGRVSARYVQWGRGKFHVQRDDEDVTVCGRDVPDDARTTIYSPVLCDRCRKDVGAVTAAEAERKARFDRKDAAGERILEKNRAGQFIVVRCRKCGMQHVGGGIGQGTPFCMRAHHEADLEVVEVTGPAWNRAPQEASAA